MNVILVNPFTCSPREEFRQFDPDQSPEFDRKLSDFLKQLSQGDIVVGVTADDVSGRFDRSRGVLLRLGASVTDIQRSGAFAFVAQNGFPGKTVQRKYRHEQEGLQPEIIVVVTGTNQSRYR